ncbi:unnamed protein product [Didymodactylos carnosus]|uniref:Uncharacterized protein n=1 Tax=Didymodactylos carnosus TaxID=1234261 RepID=A0A815PNJ5_9BILA|nr:unnamed protein product [Didymodactylos carnosus]CAF1451877.1 unnamed protein product [Didymodactylos carnosus]CAF3500897.1 unnamed protein product [Didymodactylos carnosus]CAF4324924.1 unnamed protein product [Didymodactylos carnosus]
MIKTKSHMLVSPDEIATIGKVLSKYGVSIAKYNKMFSQQVAFSSEDMNVEEIVEERPQQTAATTESQTTRQSLCRNLSRSVDLPEMQFSPLRYSSKNRKALVAPLTSPKLVTMFSQPGKRPAPIAAEVPNDRKHYGQYTHTSRRGVKSPGLLREKNKLTNRCDTTFARTGHRLFHDFS